MDTSYLTFDFLEKVMGMSKAVQEKYSDSLQLIKETGLPPEKAFQQTGFIKAYEDERGDYAS